MTDLEKIQKAVGFKISDFESLDSYYYDLCNALNQNEEVYGSVNRVKKVKSKKNYQAIKDSIGIFDALGIKLHDVNVTSVSTYDDINNVDIDNEKITSKKQPNEIPLYLIDTRVMCREFDPTFSELEITNVKGLDHIHNEISFLSLGLDKSTPDIAGSYYNHEIMHTQLNSVRESYINYFDSDVLPIFFELLTSSFNGNEELVYALRLNQLSNDLRNNLFYTNFNREEEIKIQKNIVSTLKAIKLFNIYKESDDWGKKMMMRFIQTILNGDSNVDWLLNQYDISEHNSRLDIKTLVR